MQQQQQEEEEEEEEDEEEEKEEVKIFEDSTTFSFTFRSAKVCLFYFIFLRLFN